MVSYNYFLVNQSNDLNCLNNPRAIRKNRMNLKLYSLFTDHMVLQQQEPVLFRGWAEPGATVTIQFAGQTAQTTATEGGTWQLRFPPVAAGGPFEVIVTCGDDCIHLRNVMVGEVWVCSGQSNMEWPLSGTANGAQFIAKADHSQIRLLKMPRTLQTEVPHHVEAQWKIADGEAVANFSALAYHFGVALQKALGVPVGLIDAAWGGSIIEAWTPRHVLQSDAEFGPLVEAYEKSLPHYSKSLEEHETILKEWNRTMPPADPGNTKFADGWAAADLDDSDWLQMTIPCWWQRGGHDFSGVLWFRKEIEIPAECEGRDLVLHLGACDKSDVTYFNNVEVGGIPPHIEDCWRTPRVYKIPGHLVRRGRNVLTTRVFSNIHAGGLTGPAAAMRIEAGDWSVALAGLWRFKVEHNFGRVQMPPEPWGPKNFASPSILFTSLIAPLLNFKIRGAIWYQGESNEYRPDLYRRLFPAMISGWRKEWQQEFAFVFVQLPNFGPQTPKQTLWSEIRDAQAAALVEPRTAMVPTLDIGDPNDLHPSNKEEVGRRLCLAARALAYDHKEPGLLAPVFSSAETRHGQLVITLKHACEGLKVQGDQPIGFEVAGADGVFVAAQARINGSEIVLWAEGVTNPVAARYAWADNPVCNIFSATGLPLAPFSVKG